jgi:hypothetical protein
MAKREERKVTIKGESFVVVHRDYPDIFVVLLQQRSFFISAFCPMDADVEVIAANGRCLKPPETAVGTPALIRPNDGFLVKLLAGFSEQAVVRFRRKKSGALTASVPPEITIVTDANQN